MVSLKTLLFGAEERIARRLVVLIIAFSSAITLLISAVQLAVEYGSLRDEMERTLERVGIFVPGLSGNVWSFDDDQIRLALDALRQLPTVDWVGVSTTDDMQRWSAGEILSARVVKRNYPLYRSVRGTETQIGTLTIVASLDVIYRQIAASALAIVTSNGLKTFFVALFMVFLLRRVVTSRLEKLARKVGELEPSILAGETAPQAPAALPAHLDEIDAVDWTLDKMAVKLKRTEQRLKLAATAFEAQVGIVVTDANCMIVQVNRAFSEMTGYSAQDAVGHTLSLFEPDQHDAAFYATIRERVQSTGSWQGEIWSRRKSGEIYPELFTVAAISDDEGRIVRYVGTKIDITERVHSAEEISRIADRLAQAQRIGKLGYLDLDLASGVLTLSEHTVGMYRLDKDRTTYALEEITRLLHPDDRERVERSLQAAIGGAGRHDMEHRMICPDGTLIRVHATAELIRDREGKPVRLLGTNVDITAQWEAKEKVRVSLREKETLLREIHHRVKNNLQIISSLLHFQSRKARSPEDLAVFDEGRERLKSMILVHEKLYQSESLSRIEFGDYARSLIGQVSSAYRDKLGTVEVTVDATMAHLPIEVALPLGMLLSELLTNAFKYAYADGRSGRVRVAIDGAGGNLRLEVADDGVGLPEEVDPGAPASFGMQLVANLAEQLGGEVRYERAAGLRVAVCVPLDARTVGEVERAA